MALQGVIIQIICHGLSTGALFILVGVLQERLHTRDLREMGGLWSAVPRMGGIAMFFALASLGLPGLGNFIGEFLILMGSYAAHPALVILAALGLVSATIYSLWIVQQAFHCETPQKWTIPDLSGRETITQAALMVMLLWLGLYPQPVFNATRPAIDHLQQIAPFSPRLQDRPIRNTAMNHRLSTSAPQGDRHASR